MLVTLYTIIFTSCSKTDNTPTPEDLTDKAFYGVAIANCPSTNVTNLTSSEYIFMSFVDNTGNSISYQPLPNTWYKMNTANTYVKTGSDVSPKDAVVTWDFSSTVRTAPCQ
ncbi:hypothetical protein [Flavobacterium sp.]|uniref:hypothetical protein n=1 Tax=Flavobacterium sp. TaxID=239 RepID=UPI00334179FD